MKVAILLLVGIVLVSAYTESEYQNAFTSWMQEMKKSYTAAEFQTRYTIFKRNMDYVRDHNAKNTGLVLGMTNMADLTNQEYRQIYLGTHVDISGNAGVSAPAKKFMAPPKKISVGTTYNLTIDWTAKGIVTPIKNQGQCGSCWSFSTTGSLEGAHAQKTGQLVSLSEQNLMDCSTAEGDNGCNGGLMSDAFTYIIKNGGIDTEESYPYQAVQGSCKYKAANSGATVASYTNVTSESETALQTAASQQPVSVAIDASHDSFQLYKSGIYHDIFCSQTKLDHGVLVVGYGTSSESENFWKVKNSWGTTWGMEGYIYMSKDKNNNCGIASVASYPTV